MDNRLVFSTSTEHPLCDPDESDLEPFKPKYRSRKGRNGVVTVRRIPGTCFNEEYTLEEYRAKQARFWATIKGRNVS